MNALHADAPECAGPAATPCDAGPDCFTIGVRTEPMGKTMENEKRFLRIVELQADRLASIDRKFETMEGRLGALRWMIGCMMPHLRSLSRDDLHASLSRMLADARRERVGADAFMALQAEASLLIEAVIDEAPPQDGPVGHGSRHFSGHLDRSLERKGPPDESE